MAGKRDETHKNCEVNQSLDELAVVHGAHARNQTQCSSQPRAGRIDQNRHRGSRRDRRCSLHPGCKTRLAIDSSHYIALAGVTERLPAGAAICRCGPFGVDGAVHDEAPSLLVFRPATRPFSRLVSCSCFFSGLSLVSLLSFLFFFSSLGCSWGLPSSSAGALDFFNSCTRD